VNEQSLEPERPVRDVTRTGRSACRRL